MCGDIREDAVHTAMHVSVRVFLYTYVNIHVV